MNRTNRKVTNYTQQPISCSYCILYFCLIVLYSPSINYALLSSTKRFKCIMSQFFQMLSNCNTSIITETFFVIKTIFITRIRKYLLQSLKISTQHNAVSKAISSIILSFLVDIITICYSVLRLISKVQLQQLNTSCIVSFSLIAAIS